MEDFQSCVKYCNQAGADDIIVDSQSKGKSRLVADGFAYKGNTCMMRNNSMYINTSSNKYYLTTCMSLSFLQDNRH